GGEGGDAGDAERPWCTEESGRAGSDGQNGNRGNSGSRGSDGADGGDPDFQQVTLEEWERYYTAPYLVSASSPSDVLGDDIVTVQGGEVLTLETLNLSGSATLYLDDEYDNSAVVQAYALTELGGNQYSWTVPAGLDASRFTLLISRNDDGELSNTYRVEVLSDIEELTFGTICVPQLEDPTTSALELVTCSAGNTAGVTYLTEDAFEARLGGWAHIIGTGLRADSDVIYDGESLGLPVAGTLDDGRDILSFQIPIQSVHDTFFAGDEGDVEHSVFLDQIAPLQSSEEMGFTLLKNYRMTFAPSVNGFEFSNAAMTPVAKADANARIWQSFREVYGKAEVDAELLCAGIKLTAGVIASGPVGILAAIVDSADLWGSFLIFPTFWDPTTASAMCTGMSTHALNDYFNGVNSQIGVTTTDVDHSIMLAQSRILSEELLSSFLGQMATPATSTRDTVEELVTFLRDGSADPSAEAPMFVFLPELNSLGSLANAHTVVPYQVVYEDPSDLLPSRVYLYDNNAPASGLWSAADPSIVDRVFLEIEESNGDVEFTYDMLDGSFSSPYDHNTDADWVLAHETPDSGLGEASLPLGFLDLILPG
ncbi:MAG: hypothetical protein SGJ19_09310, partial [Planctomycetia bacterium]|nr:hypothetical protein [Planctomycetia bacterium]